MELFKNLFRKKTAEQPEPEAQVTFYDGGKRAEEGETVVADPSFFAHETVNLCKREKRWMTYERFFLIIALVFLLMALIEFLAVYRPYSALEDKEAQLAADQATLSELYGGMLDRNEVRENYRKYNYENFPAEIVDREKVLDLLERTVFLRGKISGVTLSGNTLVLSITGVERSEIEAMQIEIRESDIVESVVISRTDLDETAAVGMTIVFKDATAGGNANG